jgi:hypothetical protein
MAGDTTHKYGKPAFCGCTRLHNRDEGMLQNRELHQANENVALNKKKCVKLVAYQQGVLQGLKQL